MSKLPRNVKPAKMAKIVKKLGFVEVKKRGGHRDFRHPDGRRTSISIHPKPIPQGTLSKILKQIQISKEELNELV
jgi:predicted RNA binding protein YcfA (HicA-like mRNA interferase family)